MRRCVFHRLMGLAVLLLVSTGCSLRTYAVNMVGDALASGDSVYETDDDIELVGSALPFALKLTESLLAQSPNHEGLLLTACRGYVLYSYAYVAHEAERIADDDIDRAREVRRRARRLYERALRNGFRALEHSYPGVEHKLLRNPSSAFTPVPPKRAAQDVPLLYWTAAALGLAISVSKDDAAMLARLPEVDALLERALAIDEDWESGALHEFKVILAGTRPGPPDRAAIDRHYQRALQLSKGTSAGLYVSYAESVAVPAQDRPLFELMLRNALAVDPEQVPKERLGTALAHRRARWLLGRADDLIPVDGSRSLGGER